MATATLDATLARYTAALDELQAWADSDIAAAVLPALLARDALARALAAEGPPGAEAVARLAALDERLRSAAPAIERACGVALLRWRQTLGPPAAAWWWSLDAIAAEAEPRPSVLWRVAAGFFLTLSISLATDISRRFLSGGPDFVGVFSTVTQGLLALLAGSTFVQAGQGWIEKSLSRLGIGRRRHHRWRAGLALAVLGIILVLRFSLPLAARLYNDRGVLLQSAGQATSAIESYRRAISLSADTPQAHYNLATAYEDVLDFDAAMTEYQVAIRAAPRLYAAQVNLARLYNLRRKEYANALSLLNAALAQQPLDAATQYSLYKNRGWAHFGLRLHGLAESDLRRALSFRPDGAAAHCLLAQVFEAQDRREAALAAWGDCLAYDAAGEGVEADWHATAQERLAGGKPR